MKYLSGIVFIISSALSMPLLAEEVAVIVNQNNMQELTDSQVNAVYTDQLTTWNNGQPIHVYQLPLSDNAREVFSQRIMGQSARRVERENANRKITNSFENPPLTKSAKLALIYVSRDINAIAYVPLEMARDKQGVRILLTLK